MLIAAVDSGDVEYSCTSVKNILPWSRKNCISASMMHGQLMHTPKKKPTKKKDFMWQIKGECRCSG